MKSKRFAIPLLVLTFTVLIMVSTMSVNMLASPSQLPASAPLAQATLSVDNASFRTSPIMFIENVGQWDEHAKFQVWGGSAMWLAEDAIWITVMEPPEESRQMPPAGRFDPTSDLQPPTSEPFNGVNIKLSFPGANPRPTIETFDRLDTTISYFYGNDPDQWRPDVPVWGGVRYVDLWPGVDLEVGSQNGRFVQRFVMREGADVSGVRLMVEGADKLSLGQGWLNLSTEVQELAMPLPKAEFTYQVERQNASGVLDTLDASQAVTIQEIDVLAVAAPAGNPASLFYSTFLGGTFSEEGQSIAVDGSGRAYVTGRASSAYFPTTPGAFDTTSGYHDAFVVRLNATGNALDYATFLGGDDWDSGSSIAVDESNKAYVSGYTESADFPTTSGAFDTSYNGGNSDAFVVRLNATGSALDYATFLGGNNSESGASIAVDESDRAYVTGNTKSEDFPTTPDAFDTSYNGNRFGDAFIVRLNAAGNALDYATFLGGSTRDVGMSVAVDESGRVYVIGFTKSADFPTTPGAFDTSYNNGGYHGDAFVARLNAAGNTLDYATFLGGSEDDIGYSIAVDGSGRVYVVGITKSADFPTTPGAFDTSYNDDGDYYDAFVVRLNMAGNALDYATFLGGVDHDLGYSIAVDELGGAYVAGLTRSVDFHGFYSGDNRYAFVVRLNAAGNALDYATFLGGSDDDRARAIAMDGSGRIYIIGHTNSADFPTTPGAFDTSLSGGGDIFVAKLPSFFWKQEAENAVLSGAMQQTQIDTASSCQYVSTPNHFDSNDVISFSFTVSRTGYYYLWARAMGLSWGEDSFFLSMDGQEPFPWHIPHYGAMNQWVWGRAHLQEDTILPYYLTAGTHTIRFIGRENNSRLDEVILTDDAYFHPVSPSKQCYGPTASPTPAPLTCYNAFSDNFNSSLSQRWWWIDPVADATKSVTARADYLRIAAPDGNDLHPDNNYDAPRLIQALEGDFVIKTRVHLDRQFNPTEWHQGAGLLLWQDNDNFLRLERGYSDTGGGGNGIRFVKEEDGIYSSVTSTTQWPTIATVDELRLQRVGDHFAAWWREPEQTWQYVGGADIHLNQQIWVGLVVIAQNNITDASADFDYFHSSCDVQPTPIPTMTSIPPSTSTPTVTPTPTPTPTPESEPLYLPLMMS